MPKDALAEVTPPKATGHRFRDELNFAEFPIAAVADTVAENVKTLEFTDEIFDPSTNKPVTRTLVITAADKFGLPTALDDEVLLGLIQLSCAKGFADRKVHFSRYELIKLLGWRDESKSYRRVEESLYRWAGVTLHYRKAWWSKEERCWVNETFHVIDQVTVFDRERIERRRKMAKGSPEKALSSFAWNEAVFQSFQVGYIKSLDFDFYKSLKSAIAKRMFRFLDKRFYHKGRWEFDLRTYACEHVGLSKNYSNSELKRKLLPAVRELEEREFLSPLPDTERFVKTRPGAWHAVFVKAGRKVTVLPRGETTDLIQALVARGITPKSAEKLVSRHPRARIEEKVRLFDGVKARGGEGAIRNRAGWLYSAIVHDYAVVEDATQKPPHHSRSPVLAALTQTPKAVGASESTDDEPSPVRAFLARLSDAEQSEFEVQAVALAPAFLRKQYTDGAEQKGTLWRFAREQILAAHFERTCGRVRG